MFRLVMPETVTVPVTICAPGGSPGDVVLTLRYRGMADSIAYLEYLRDEDVDDRRMLDETIVGWSGVQDADGQPLAWDDPAARAKALDAPYFFLAVRDAVLDEIFHRGAARKN